MVEIIVACADFVGIRVVWWRSQLFTCSNSSASLVFGGLYNSRPLPTGSTAAGVPVCHCGVHARTRQSRGCSDEEEEARERFHSGKMTSSEHLAVNRVVVVAPVASKDVGEVKGAGIDSK